MPCTARGEVDFRYLYLRGGREEDMGAEEAREALDVAYELSKVLNCGVDRETLAVLVALTERGVNPEALVAAVKELRREGAALRKISTPGTE